MARAVHCGACSKPGHTVRKCADDLKVGWYLLFGVWNVLDHDAFTIADLGASRDRVHLAVSAAARYAREGSAIEALERAREIYENWPIGPAGPASPAIRAQVARAINRLSRFVEAGTR